MNSNNRGSALIIALWIIVLLSMFVVSFTYDAEIESRIISYYRKRHDAEYLARSGVAIAEMLMGKSAEIKGNEPDEVKMEEDPWYNDAFKLKGMSDIRIEKKVDNGFIIVQIRPEEARRNVNKLKTADWERALEVGGVPEDMWPVLIESFQDWVDNDDNPRFDGAETDDYYALLERPYMAKNDKLDTVDELMLIRGFDNAVLYGGKLQTGADNREEVIVGRGIADLLTVYGDGRVNPNAAGKEVLMTLPGIDEVEADTIIEEVMGFVTQTGEYEGDPFENTGDFLNRTQLPENLKSYITTDSAIYRITSVGNVAGVKRSVQCVGQYSGKKLNILRWLEY